MMDGNNPLTEDLNHILDHTLELWEELRGERIFITGGTGFFGCWLLESFIWANQRLNLNARATVLTRSPQKFRVIAPHLAGASSIAFYQGDVRDFAFPDSSFPFMIHAATESSARLNEEQPLVMLDTIVQGTRRVLDFAAACGTKKLLFTSSGAVYGRQPPEMTHIPEDFMGAPDPMELSSAYGIGKRNAEHLCALYARQYSFETKIARCFAFVGPYLPLDAHFAIGNFIRDALNGGPIVVKGDGTPYRSYLYAADLAIWLWTILFKGESCIPYNVGSDQAYTIKELANIVASSINGRMDVRIMGTQKEGDKAERYIPDVALAKERLKLFVTFPIIQSISKTKNWVAGTILGTNN